MNRAIAFAVLGLVFVSCDPVYRVSASRPIQAALGRKCLIDALRAEETVQNAGEFDDGTIYAELVIPDDVKGTSGSFAVVEQRSSNNGEPEIVFVMNLGPRRESPRYEAYVQLVLEKLLDRTIERCGK